MLPLSAAGPSHGEASQSSNHQAPAHPPPTHPPSGDPARCCGVPRGGLQRFVASMRCAGWSRRSPFGVSASLPLDGCWLKHIADGCLAVRIVANETCSLAAVWVWLVPAASSRRIAASRSSAQRARRGRVGSPPPWRAFVHANASTWPLLADQQATRDRVGGRGARNTPARLPLPLPQPLGVTAMSRRMARERLLPRAGVDMRRSKGSGASLRVPRRQQATTIERE